MLPKIGLVPLGCPKNQVDAEIMLAKLKAAGHEIVPDPADSDVCIINTCGFITDAKREAIDEILELSLLKNEGKIAKLIVTGCLSERYGGDIAKDLPEVDGIVGIGANGDIVSIVSDVWAGRRVLVTPEKKGLPLEGERLIINQPIYAYLKVAEGCDNCCSYCAIPGIRGGFRSRTMESVIDEAKTLADRGVKELILVAQDTTRYGEDIYGRLMLPELLRELSKLDVMWIRLLYCYPERVTDELLEVIKDEPKVAKYLDIPVQHASGRVLAAMNRRGDVAELTALFLKIRKLVPGITLRTTLMCGFPGENEDDFSQLCTFVRDVRFDRLGTFAFSPEEGTPAFSMDGQIDSDITARRVERIMDIAAEIAEERDNALIGQELLVVTEGFDRLGGCFFGRDVSRAPDIDGKIFFTAPKGTKLPIGSFVNVIIDEILDHDLIGILKAKN